MVDENKDAQAMLEQLTCELMQKEEVIIELKRNIKELEENATLDAEILEE
jgi:hypothetical protein